MNSNYNNYTLDDFLTDDEFINWVLKPNDELNTLWNQWVNENPHKEKTLLSARALINNIYAVEEQFAPTKLSDHTWQNIIDQTTKKDQPRPISKFKKLFNYKYAAAVACLLLASIYLFRTNNILFDSLETEKASWVIEENNTGISKMIHLSDGSTVSLEPYSFLKYPTSFTGEQRDVFLQGEAFFDVARDTTHPFLIYANETITKVLGTSFTVKAFEGDDDVQISVKTGKVAVYAKVALENNNKEARSLIVKADEEILVPLPNRKLELTPNQKIVFNKKKKELIKTIVKLPILIEKAIPQIESLEFEDALITDVFTALELAYGLNIAFDRDQLKDCTITTGLTDLPMIDKIELICQVLSLTYEEKNGEIFIYGKGC